MSQIASLVADVFSNTAVAENKVIAFVRIHIRFITCTSHNLKLVLWLAESFGNKFYGIHVSTIDFFIRL